MGVQAIHVTLSENLGIFFILTGDHHGGNGTGFKPVHILKLNYYVSADRGSGKYEITCETAGEAGNDYTGTVIPIEYVDGLEMPPKAWAFRLSM